MTISIKIDKKTIVILVFIIMAPSCYRDCLLLWKSYSRTVFLVSSLWNSEKRHYFWSLHFTIYRYTYWLSNL